MQLKFNFANDEDDAGLHHKLSPSANFNFKFTKQEREQASPPSSPQANAVTTFCATKGSSQQSNKVLTSTRTELDWAGIGHQATTEPRTLPSREAPRGHNNNFVRNYGKLLLQQQQQQQQRCDDRRHVVAAAFAFRSNVCHGACGR